MNDFPRIAPPADGLVLAMTTARSRRLRKASASSGASALALTMVAVLAGTSGRSTLTQQPTPEQPAVVVQVVPDGQERTSDQQAKPNVLTSVPGTTVRSGTAAPLGSGSPLAAAPGYAPSGRDTTRSGGSSIPAAPYKAGPVTREDQNSVTLPTCAVQGDGQSYTTCPFGYAQANDNRTHAFEVQLCNNDTKPLTLLFPGRNEVDFAVFSTTPDASYTPNKEVWRWSTWHAQRSAEHTHVIDTASCTTWAFTYTDVDGSGRPLPKGDYLMRSSLLTSAGRTAADVSFTVS